MSGFASVPARISGRVVFRVHALGSVWAWRAPSKGQRPAPAALFLPARSVAQAQAYARAARSLGWRATVKPGAQCAVWSAASPLASSAPPVAAKLVLPFGLSAAQARAQLRAAWGAR